MQGLFLWKGFSLRERTRLYKDEGVCWNAQVVSLILILQQVLETGKRFIGGRRLRPPSRRLLGVGFSHLEAGVLVVVTIDAQQLPVAAVGRIVIMVVVFVVDGQLAQLFSAKFSSAAGTDPGIHLERSFPIGLLPLLPVAPDLVNHPVQPFGP